MKIYFRHRSSATGIVHAVQLASDQSVSALQTELCNTLAAWARKLSAAPRSAAMPLEVGECEFTVTQNTVAQTLRFLRVQVPPDLLPYIPMLLKLAKPEHEKS